jgi:predicted ATPase/class 3 adenylate cyclase
MDRLPSGTVTFLFTDIEGSTQLWETQPEAMKDALAKHDSILREAIESNNGHVIKTTGDGIHGAFEKAIDAVQATLSAQRNLQAPINDLQIKVRMGMHTGEAELRASDYYGQALNRAARIMTVAHGGQILLSSVTAELAREHLPLNTSLLDLGEHRLRDLIRPEHIYQLQSSDLPKDFPVLTSLDILPNNLPPQLTSFIGREHEMDEARNLLSATRLLTLIGPGGTGKTRLSLQIAAEQLSNFKDGVWLVELAPLTDPAFIISTIASTFEVREVLGVPLSSIVIDYLRARQLLLIFDNCEHLIEAIAQIADQLLHACPQLKIISSSREALGIHGETVYRVPSLSLPDNSADSLMRSEATRLFIERAKKAEPRFHLTDHNASPIAQICLRLDGIPLAIELAAARIKLFTPEQIAERLDDRFKLLTGGSRTALPRQQTLRALIDWSYQSLKETEQCFFRRLAVFSGGWTFEAAESVIGEMDTMEGLLGLVNKSLVSVDEQDGESRYRFLETIRQYAMEKLVESGEAAAVRDRHLDQILSLAYHSPQGLFGTEDTKSLDRIEVEHDNLRAALEWATATNPEKALKLAYAVGGFWTIRDHISEARVWCQVILEKSKHVPDVDEHRGRVYGVLGWMSVTTGEHKAGRAAAEQAISLARKTNDAITLARAYGVLALSSVFLGDYPAAQHAVTEGEILAREQGLKSELALMLTTRAQMEYLSKHDLAQAMTYLDEATKVAREARFRWASSFAVFGLARTAAALGDLETARAGFKESAEIAKKMGNRRIVYSSQSEFAHILREHGELDEPLATYRDLLPKWKDLGHRAAVAHELECIAYILVRKNEPKRAANLLGAAEALREIIDSSMTYAEKAEYEREILAVRAQVDHGELEKAWNEGRAMTMDEAITLALHAN